MTGVSIMKIDSGFDTGPILMQEQVPVGSMETADSLSTTLSHLGANLLIRTLEDLDRLPEAAQDDSAASYAHRINRNETEIDWSRPAAEVDCTIRGLSSQPGAWSAIGGKRLRILASQTVDSTPSPLARPGTVLDSDLTVACGTGALRLLRLQRAGKRPLDAAVFLRGFPLKPGQAFGEWPK